MVMSLVAAELGVGLVTASTGQPTNQNLVYLDLVDPTPVAEFNLVWRRDTCSPLVDAFLRVVEAVLPREAREETVR
jgi:DNA-binding transcriptional LysR family regulator